jgi:hypothetical protein
MRACRRRYRDETRNVQGTIATHVATEIATVPTETRRDDE